MAVSQFTRGGDEGCIEEESAVDGERREGGRWFSFLFLSVSPADDGAEEERNS